jgi:dolichol-phosphate mannosyltransferase
MDKNFAVVIPMANESSEFMPFIQCLRRTLDEIGGGSVYIVVDNASKDNTLDLCRQLSLTDDRFHTVWAPENRNVVDAYLRGYAEAYRNGHEFIIEMDAGMSHDPAALPEFLLALDKGNDCAYGSRFIGDGKIMSSSFKRKFLSKGGTVLANLLLGTHLHDMTSGYQGFNSEVVGKFLKYKLHSKAHFYQTELKFLLRKMKCSEIPIVYRTPSENVNLRVVINSIAVLLRYFFMRVTLRSPFIE